MPALVICELYKRRWQVELFFKWIKQHLRHHLDLSGLFSTAERLLKIANQ
jgi:IS4 transposase